MVKDYILSITAAALICGIVNVLVPKKSATGTVIRLISGVYLSLCVISPLLQLQISNYIDFNLSIFNDAKTLVAQGESITANTKEEIIKSKTNTYILDKADSMGADVEVETAVAKEQPQVPVAIVIKGTVSPYVKSVLSEWISQNIGVPKEAQQWIG